MIKWTQSLVIKELKRISEQIGHSPSISEVPSYLYGASCNHFGTFNKAKLSADLIINKTKHNKLLESAYIPSKELAYVLGVVYGDGSYSLIKNEHGSSGNIVLRVKDKDFALNFKEMIEKWSGIKASYKLDKREFHKINLSSVDACRFIDKLNLEEINKWGKELQFYFIRGLFDSDGGIVGNNLKNRKIAKRWIHFSNNNLDLINIVKDIFTKNGLTYKVNSRIHSGFGSNKLQYELKVYNFKDILYFYKNIGFSIERKQERLREVVESYDDYVKERFNIWE